jgi:hypothetical protein
MQRLRKAETGKRPGIVLLFVLVSLVIAATALVSVARQSYRMGTDALRARRELQQKWGPASLNRAMLPVATTIFEERDKTARKARLPAPSPELLGDIVLGDVQFQFVLADEDARANVNSLYHFSDRESAAKAVQELSSAIGAVALNGETESVGADRMVRPARRQLGATANTDAESERSEEDASRTAPIAFRSWGQVFDLSRVSNLQQVTRRLTCWGSEAINVRRAEEETAVEVAGLIMGRPAARRMITDFKKSPANQIRRTIDRYSTNAQHRLQLKRLLSESSMCYSLWVRSIQKSEVRDSFAVLAPGSEGTFRTTEIEYRGR